MELGVILSTVCVNTKGLDHLQVIENIQLEIMDLKNRHTMLCIEVNIQLVEHFTVIK